MISVLGLIKNPYPVLSETQFAVNWKHILELDLKQKPFIDTVMYRCILLRGVAPVNGQGNFELQLEESLKYSGNNRPWRWRNKAY